MSSQMLSKLRRTVAFAAAATVAFPSTMAMAQAAADAPKAQESKMSANITQLQKIDTTLGTGAEAVKGKTAVVHYTGWLYDPYAPDKKGKKFDSSLDRGSPFSFPLGGGRVIAGWDEGVVGMKVGGKRKLLIPAGLGYGARGAGYAIPPDADLVFEVEMLKIS